MRRFVLLFTIVFVLVAAAGACDNAKAAEHQAQMKALLTKVSSTWDQVQKAATPAAMKAHSDALAELQAMHEKHLAAQSGEKKMDCKAMMAKMKAEGKECECCKEHKDHPAKAD